MELVQTNVSQVLAYNNVRNGVKHEANVPSVRGACEVRIDFFFGFLAIQIFKLHSYVVFTVLVSVGACTEVRGCGVRGGACIQSVNVTHKQYSKGFNDSTMILVTQYYE